MHSQKHVKPPTPELPAVRPRLSMQRSIVKWMMGVATLSVLVCLVIFNLFVRVHLAKAHRQDGAMLGEVVAASLSGHMLEQWRDMNAALIDSLRRHPKVAFVCLTDVEGQIKYTGVFKPEPWYAFQKRERKAFAAGQLDISRSVTVDLGPGLIVRTQHVRPPGWARGIRPSGATEQDLEGAIVLGLFDSDLAGALWRVQSAQLLTILVVAIVCFPISRSLVRKWSTPLRELLRATERLAAGRPPKPVAIVTNDEMGFLSSAFNDMAARLIAGRKDLIAANTSLEKKVQDRTRDLQLAVRQLEEMASTDPLTGLTNRRAFNEALTQMFRQSVVKRNDLACVMIDLDGFKRINDTLGHETGDRLLTLVARVLKENCRRTDVVGRLGGDEFIVLMPGADEATATQVGDRILASFNEEAAELIQDPELADRLTMSAGIAFRLRSDPESPAELMSQADMALYQAKGSGKACLRFYEAKAA